ncbi:hypothetical protein CLV59_10796 [Chitinophaga dinghuensis]|uniref:Uncharacterized protein n=1 Tax=Chitinophaga dinghuensis TaxID=1539050 RepID=A0A327VTG7_9BACT|nr:hypothetical protein [Chitinophaga dinghuensis]RAJ77329.1 hypothetical protein CLV59_10796 [Chitinophaga dinghuensis]
MHVINQEKQRLEPVEKKCQYCEEDESTDMEDNYFLPLFSEQDRTNIVVYRSVKYSKILVGIPRCRRCRNIHVRAQGIAVMWTWGIAAAVVILSFVAFGIFGMFSILAAVFITVLGKQLIQNIITRKKGIYTLMDGAKQNEAVQELVLAGWSLTPPSA